MLSAGCRSSVPSRLADGPVQYLSQSSLYSEAATHTVASNNRLFAPRFELWSDGGAKKRWVQLPDDGVIDTSDMDAWTFPPGTIVWKEFVYGGKRVETRMLEKLDEAPGPRSWIVSVFLWDQAETDAVRVNHGLVDVAPTVFGTSHDVPSVDDCVTCHNTGGDVLLGFGAVQLAGAGEGVRLADLVREGRLSVPPAREPTIPGDPQAQEVYGALHANCAYCHNPRHPAGPVSVTRLNLEVPAGATSEDELPVMTSAVGALTTSYEVPGKTLGVNSYNVERGSPAASALWLRAKERDDMTVAMPPLGSEVPDAGFVSTLQLWISGL